MDFGINIIMNNDVTLKIVFLRIKSKPYGKIKYIIEIQRPVCRSKEEEENEEI